MPSEKAVADVPNQRVLTISKQPTDKTHLYTCNNLEALGQAARALQTKGGFKLYMYLAKNQDKYNFALYSSDFLNWSGMGIAAYNSAFNELKEKGYLIPKDASKEKETIFTFFDKSAKVEAEETRTIIENPTEKVEEVKSIQEQINDFKSSY